MPGHNDDVFGGGYLNSGCCTIADIKDGTSNTLMVGEVTAGGPGTYWEFLVRMEHSRYADGINGYRTVPGGTYPPGPLGSLDAGFASFHPGGCNFAMADGSVSFVVQNIADAIRKALTTRDGMSRRSYTIPATEIMISGPP